jgi:translation initiation factor IF-1
MSNNNKDVIVLEGIVESIINDQFKVIVSEDHICICKPSGKFRLSSVKCLPGDRVKIEISPYDMTKGRVVYRIKV